MRWATLGGQGTPSRRSQRPARRQPSHWLAGDRCNGVEVGVVMHQGQSMGLGAGCDQQILMLYRAVVLRAHPSKLLVHVYCADPLRRVLDAAGEAGQESPDGPELALVARRMQHLQPDLVTQSDLVQQGGVPERGADRLMASSGKRGSVVQLERQLPVPEHPVFPHPSDSFRCEVRQIHFEQGQAPVQRHHLMERGSNGFALRACVENLLGLVEEFSVEEQRRSSRSRGHTYRIIP